jgi:hypothetical protein
MLDEPKNERWGSEAEAPIFAAIAGETLRYLKVAPRDTAPVPIFAGPAPDSPMAARGRLTGPGPTAGPEGEPLMPDLTGTTLREALAALAPYQVTVKVAGRGRVASHQPVAGAALERGEVVRLVLARTAAGPTRSARAHAAARTADGGTVR